MALFDSFFKSGSFAADKRNGETYFNFRKEQIRVMLFKECHYCYHKVLFDSNIMKSKQYFQCDLNDKKIVEKLEQELLISSSEWNKLIDMIFGVTAMKFKGTSFKIHSLCSPKGVMFSQVFSSPHGKISKMSNTFSSFSQSRVTCSPKHSNKFSDSSGSSISTVRCQHGSYLDVLLPNSSALRSGSNLDSGFGDSSANDLSSRIDSTSDSKITTSDTFSSDNSYGTSNSLGVLDSSLSLSGSMKTHTGKSYHSSKLALSIIIDILPQQENHIDHFLLDHVVFMEHLLWKCRINLESIYRSSRSLFSLMMEVKEVSESYLMQLFHKAQITSWLTFSSLYYKNVPDEIDPERKIFEDNTRQSKLSLRKFFGMHERRNTCEGDGKLLAENFFKEFCLLIEKFDVKSTNFFLSRLLTATLTHHLGWVSFGLVNDINDKSTHSFNALWSQLEKLFGAVGYPLRTVQTIIATSNHKENLTKLTEVLTYFLRCHYVDRNCARRSNIEKEHSDVTNELRRINMREQIGLTSIQKKSTIEETHQRINKNKTGLIKSKTHIRSLSSICEMKIDAPEKDFEDSEVHDDVVFILGENDKLIDIENHQDFVDMTGTLGNNQQNVSRIMCESRSITENNNNNSSCNPSTGTKSINIIRLPMPSFTSETSEYKLIPYTSSLITGTKKDFFCNMLLQSIHPSTPALETQIKRHLSVISQHHFLDKPVEESLAILGDLDAWRVELLSNLSSPINRKSSNAEVDLSELVASLLESLLEMYKCNVPPELCLLHLEQRLHEIYLKSKAMAHFLLSTDFCTMDFLTSSLQIEASEVPLLLAVASTYLPEVTQKYGVGYS